MNKRGDSQVISKSITITIVILVILVLAFAISRQYLPSVEQVEGKANQVLLFLNNFGNMGEVESECSSGTEQVIPEILGVFELCPENCSIVISSSLLGYDRFVFDGDSYAVVDESLKSDVVFRSDAFGVKSSFSDRQRDAYLALNNYLLKFYVEKMNDGQGVDDFFDPLDFDFGSYFGAVIKPLEGARRNLQASDEFYFWDGTNWYRRLGDTEEIIGANTDALLENLYDDYSSGLDVYWTYKNEDSYFIPVNGFDVNYKYIQRSELEISNWLKKRMAEIDSLGDESFYVGFEGVIYPDYYYKNSIWRKDGFWFLNRKVDFDDVLENIVFANEDNFDIYWFYESDEDTHFTIVDDDEIVLRSSISKSDFENSFYEVKFQWEDDLKNQLEFMSEFADYVSENEFSVLFDSVEYELKSKPIVNEDGKSVILFYFESEIGETFGIYYLNDKFVLTYGSSNSDSIVSDFVGLGEKDWDDFLKINDLFSYLKEKCTG